MAPGGCTHLFHTVLRIAWQRCNCPWYRDSSTNKPVPTILTEEGERIVRMRLNLPCPDPDASLSGHVAAPQEHESTDAVPTEALQTLAIAQSLRLAEVCGSSRLGLLSVKVEEEETFKLRCKDFAYEMRGSLFEADIWPSSSSEEEEGTPACTKRRRTHCAPTCLSYADARLGEKAASLVVALDGAVIDVDAEGSGSPGQPPCIDCSSEEDVFGHGSMSCGS